MPIKSVPEAASKLWVAEFKEKLAGCKQSTVESASFADIKLCPGHSGQKASRLRLQIERSVPIKRVPNAASKPF